MKRVLFACFSVLVFAVIIYLLFTNLLFGIGLFIISFLAAPYVFVAFMTDKTGVWKPASYYQRYRGEEYPVNKNFFQWWYFSLKDYQEDLSFAFCYSISRPAEDQKNTGAYLLFAVVEPQSKGHLYYKYPIDSFKVDNHFDVNIGDSKFTIEVISDDHYRIKGVMNSEENVWVTEGIPAGSEIVWDLDIYRAAGWYGQQDIEWMQRKGGQISWNTYAYNSEVEGTVTVDGREYSFERSKRYRIYCDMNWGETFPGTRNPKKQQIDYPWGWYYTGKPDDDPQKDFSIIAGAGRTQPTKGLLNDMYARFASIYIRGKKIDARLCKVFDVKPDKGIAFFHPSSDKTCKVFSVERSSWEEYEDEFGKARIPMVQIIKIETDSNKIVMKFESKKSNYNRLLFPTDGYIFSDFEGLGVLCTTELYEKKDGAFSLVETIVDNNAGLEYGYRIDDELDQRPFLL